MENNQLLKAAFINVDKPAGMTSHDVCAILKKLLDISSVGHAGTLDPMVTGVLPIGIGKATRLLQYLDHDKEYVGVMDIHEDIDDKKLNEAIKMFTGKIKQTPPKKSSVKRVEREREVYSFKIIEREGRKVLFRVHCEAGTYIRKLVSDLGEKLGIGAHMLELRRIKAGEFSEENSFTLYQIAEAAKDEKELGKILLPIEIIAKKLPQIHVKEEALVKLYNGSPVYNEYIEKMDKIDEGIAAVLYKDKLVEIARANEGKIKPETIIKSD